MPAVLDVQDITVRFGGIVAVEGVSLQINDGNLVGFIGPNGAGKTTLMRAITGIVKPQSGRVLLDGHDITQYTRQPRHRRRAEEIMLDTTLHTEIQDKVMALAGEGPNRRGRDAHARSARSRTRASGWRGPEKLASCRPH